MDISPIWFSQIRLIHFLHSDIILYSHTRFFSNTWKKPQLRQLFSYLIWFYMHTFWACRNLYVAYFKRGRNHLAWPFFYPPDSPYIFLIHFFPSLSLCQSVRSVSNIRYLLTNNEHLSLNYTVVRCSSKLYLLSFMNI